MCTTKSTPVREKKLAKLSHKERIVLCMPILALHLLLHYNLTVLCRIGMLPDFAQARARALRGLSLHAMEAVAGASSCAGRPRAQGGRHTQLAVQDA